MLDNFERHKNAKKEEHFITNFKEEASETFYCNKLR
jgi:hypothetical protein